MICLTPDDALFIHTEQRHVFGGASSIRDLGVLESALSRPRIGHYADLIKQAAAPWESPAMGHPFTDGNKRVAFAYMDIVLGLNGARLDADSDAVITLIYGHLEVGTLRKPMLDEWLPLHAMPPH